jgi:hypothetical protein
MKPKSTTNSAKDVKLNTVETKSKTEAEGDHECGRMDYIEVNMAYIYIRGKLMFTMSEVARNLYPEWPRTTLNDRVKQLKIQWYTCTAKEIEKVLSVKGIVKLGVHCTLISKEDLDMFSSVYKVGSPVGKPVKLSERKQTAKRISGGSRSKRTAKAFVHSKTNSMAMPRSNNSQQSQANNGNKGKTRVIVKNIKLDNGKVLEGHAVDEINKAIGKQSHVFIKPGRGRARGKQLNKIQTKGVGRPKKRKLSAVGVDLKAKRQNESYKYIPTKRHHKMRETSSPDSDSFSYDSGISSLQLDAPTPPKPGRKPGRPKSQKQLKMKEVKRKYNNMKAKKVKQTSKDTVIGNKRKGEMTKRGRKSKKGEGIKKRKMDKNSCPNTITKDLIMKMDLKHMNDKDLINSLSPLSSPLSANTTPSDDQPYLVKLMPVKPVWRVNSSFKFISNFQLPPSLVVQDGQLSPACSMICSPGKKPPSAHPIWKWRVGERVISNKTVISYRMKKVKCT